MDEKPGECGLGICMFISSVGKFNDHEFEKHCIKPPYEPHLSLIILLHSLDFKKTP